MTLKILLAISVLISSLLFSQGALAQESACGDKDISAELGDVRTQGNMGWCFANTAADLLSFKFKKQWNNFQASAIWIALGYNYKENSSDPGSYIFNDDGGDISYAISYASEFGYSCPRQLDNILVTGGFNLKLKQKLHTVEHIKKLFDKKNASAADLAEYTDYISLLRSSSSILGQLSDHQLTAALSLNINLAVVELAKQVCQPFQLPMSLDRHKDLRRYYKKQTYYYDDVLNAQVNTTPPLIDLLDRQLNSDNVVGVGYVGNLIDTNPNQAGGHASVIVGRRLRNNICQYKIRNSWGPGCTEIVAGKKVSRYGKKVVECIEDGHVWVTRSDLKATLLSITYLRP